MNRLEELKNAVTEFPIYTTEERRTQTDLLAILDAEIARQSVTDEEAQRAIAEIIGTNYGECQIHRETLETAVSALTALSTYRKPTAEEVTALVEAGKPEPQYETYTATGNSRKPTVDEVAEIDRAIEILAKGRENFSYRAINAFNGALDLAITALRRMKGSE